MSGNAGVDGAASVAGAGGNIPFFNRPYGAGGLGGYSSNTSGTAGTSGVIWIWEYSS